MSSRGLLRLSAMALSWLGLGSRAWKMAPKGRMSIRRGRERAPSSSSSSLDRFGLSRMTSRRSLSHSLIQELQAFESPVLLATRLTKITSIARTSREGRPTPLPLRPPDPANMASSSRLDAFMASPASFIDHTILKPVATERDVKQLCVEARRHDFATVCVNTRWVELCAKELDGAKTVPIAVVGFPLGACATAAKVRSCASMMDEARLTMPSQVAETKIAVSLGAKEIDMVISVGDLLAGDAETAEADIKAVVDAAAPIPVKVIIETCLLPSDDTKKLACGLSVRAGAAFVKTSTGFSTGGATVEDIRLMRGVVGPSVGVKASGGVRTFEDARRMVEAGASRIGASSSVAIIEQWQATRS